MTLYEGEDKYIVLICSIFCKY